MDGWRAYEERCEAKPMRISINLATRPFVELRPLYAKLRLAIAGLSLVALLLGVYVHGLSARAAAATQQMNALKARTAAYERQRAANESRMHQPQNMGVLERSQFLNALFAHKAFSWTAVMMDLEQVVPTGIQVTSIDPVISKEGDVSIRLRVTGDRDRAIQLVRNLERSRRFVAPRLAGESAQTAERAKALGQGAPQVPGGVRTVSATPNDASGNGVEFEIFSGYNPLAPAANQGKEPAEPSHADVIHGDAGPAVHHNRKVGAR